MPPASCSLLLRLRQFQFPRPRPLVMGIVNINDDSFSGDGTLDPQNALAIARQMVRDGADIIDVGAESARTNREAISAAEEIRRLSPFLDAFQESVAGISPIDDSQISPPLLSVNTWRPEVIKTVLPLGVDLINDISGLPDPRNAELCSEYGAALLIMHTVGLPKIAHTHQRWENVLEAMEDFFQKKIALACQTGLPEQQIILDPGIDFAKQTNDNLAIFQNLGRFHRFGRPILLPVSRKTVIGDVLDIPDPADRDPGTIACSVRGFRTGAHILRVHHVAATVKSLRTLAPLIS